MVKIPIGKVKFAFILWIGTIVNSLAQTWSGTQLSITHPSLGENGDNTSFFRVDPYSDYTNLRLRLGDEESSNFEIGYNYYANGQWYSNFSLDGYGTGYFRGNLGIGSTSPGGKLDVSSGSQYAIRTSSSQRYLIEVKNSGDPGGGWWFANDTNGNFAIHENSAGDRLTIKDGGNVGIGTTNPRGKFDVDGLGDIYLADDPNLGSGQSLFLPGHIYISPHVGGSDISFLQARRLDNSGSTSLRIRTYNNGSLNESMHIEGNGNVGIGTTTPDSKLSVKGTIHTQEVKVDLNGSVAPDYVFEEDYALTSLEELKSYIDQNKHLPEIPSAKEMEEEGINLKEMNLLLLKKVEELTLYLINQRQDLDKERRQNQKQHKEIAELKIAIEHLKEER